MLDGKGGTIGPDLSNTGAQVTLQRLRDSLTRESPILSGYHPVTVVTRKGETIKGVAEQ